MKHEIVEKIKSIKFSRLKPEEVYIIKILNNLEIYKFKILPFCMVFKYNGIIMFEYNISNKFFRCNKIYIFDLIKDKYNLTYIDTIDLIKTELNIMTLDNYISMCKKNLKHETN